MITLPRRSTWVLIALFTLILVTYLLVRPATAATIASTPKQVSSVPDKPAPRVTPRATTTYPLPTTTTTTRPAPSTTAEPNPELTLAPPTPTMTLAPTNAAETPTTGPVQPVVPGSTTEAPQP